MAELTLPSAIVDLREHGGATERTACDGGEPWLDLSANVNPFGPTKRVADAARQAPLDRYPDSTARSVRHAIALKCGRSPGEIVFGNGATELLWTLAQTLGLRGEGVLLVLPAFSEFDAAARAVGAHVHAFWTDPERGFDVDFGELLAATSSQATRVVAITNPTSPAGRPLDMDALARFAETRASTWVVLDESFLTLSENHADAGVPLPDNVVRVRSMTKDHALAGVRVGYLIAPSSLARHIEAHRPSWTTSSIAQAVALAALEEDLFIAESRSRLLQARAHMHATLADAGLRPFSSVAPYLLVDVGDARRICHGLASLRIAVRDATSFGLPRHIRVGTRGREEDAERLARALGGFRS